MIFVITTLYPDILTRLLKSQVGLIRILKTGRISDGILRLYFVAGARALEKVAEEAEVLHKLCSSWDSMIWRIPHCTYISSV